MKKYSAENIEQYLEGTLSEQERREIEMAIPLYPDLQEDIALQKALVQRMQHQAWKTMVKDAHHRHINKSNFKFKNNYGKFLLGTAIVGTITAGILIYFSTRKNISIENTVQTTVTKQAIVQEITNEVENVEVIQSSNIDTDTKKISSPNDLQKVMEHFNPLPEVSLISYSFIAERGAQITDKRSGTVIRIPANALIFKNGKSVKGKVTLKYREFRNQADMALSGLPMTFKDQNFNSAGMFEIMALQNADTLNLDKNKPVSIDFVMTKNEPGIDFYYLNPITNKWEFKNGLNNRKDAEVMEVPITLAKRDLLKKNSVGMPAKNITPNNKEPFILSMAYHKLAIEGKNSVPSIPQKDTRDFKNLFEDKNYQQPAGTDPGSSLIIRDYKGSDIVKDNMSNKKSKNGSWFSRLFSGKNNDKSLFGRLWKKLGFGKTAKAEIKENNGKDGWGPGLIISQNMKDYEIVETGNVRQLKELDALKGVRFLHQSKVDIGRILGSSIDDINITRDTTVLNRFNMDLKMNKKFYHYSIRFAEPLESNFAAFRDYEFQRSLRMKSFDEKMATMTKELTDLREIANGRMKVLDSVTKYGIDNVYNMARLIMNKDELKMSKDEWYASLKDNKGVAERINAHLDSINALGDNAEKYVQKLMDQTNGLTTADRVDALKVFKTGYYTPDPGHDYHNLVANLKISGFGVYNCDQVYRMNAPVAIEGGYLDEQGTLIGDLRVLSVIDAKVNGAFSFNPYQFDCSSTADNSLLLFTKNNKIYFLNKDQWKSMAIQKSGRYMFRMKDITKYVKSSNDLQKILKAEAL